MARILIIDDDAPAADLVAAVLRQFGYETDCAVGGDAALSHLCHSVPDLVLLDIMMPTMNGIEVLRRIRADARTAGLQVIVLSALDDEEWRDRAQQEGASDYWIKGGFDFGELEERMNACCPA
jgi:DNA-binding response OmpR family regulator